MVDHKCYCPLSSTTFFYLNKGRYMFLLWNSLLSRLQDSNYIFPISHKPMFIRAKNQMLFNCIYFITSRGEKCLISELYTLQTSTTATDIHTPHFIYQKTDLRMINWLAQFGTRTTINIRLRKALVLFFKNSTALCGRPLHGTVMSSKEA